MLFDQLWLQCFNSHATRPGQVTFTTALYEGALGRDPDASEVAGWQSVFAGGATQAAVAVGIAESSEAITRLAPRSRPASTSREWLI